MSRGNAHNLRMRSRAYNDGPGLWYKRDDNLRPRSKKLEEDRHEITYKAKVIRKINKVGLVAGYWDSYAKAAKALGVGTIKLKKIIASGGVYQGYTITEERVK
jgi:hypothetical protein